MATTFKKFLFGWLQIYLRLFIAGLILMLIALLISLYTGGSVDWFRFGKSLAVLLGILSIAAVATWFMMKKKRK